MWIVVHMVQGKKLADSIEDKLTKEGFIVKIIPVYKNVSPEENYYELMVPESEAEEVQLVLFD